MKVFINKESLEESVRYFSTLDIMSPEQLGLFFFFKSLGIDSKNVISFKKISQMNESQKEEYNDKLYQLSGIFTYKEIGEKRSCLFPFSIENNIKQKNFYNGGSVFKQLLSRITDTVDNTLVDKFLDKDINDNIKLKRNYLRYIKDTYLKGNKISIIQLSAWLCRFITFDVDSEVTEKEFTRICIKYTMDYLHINESELQAMFYDDSFTEKIGFDSSMIEGNEFRGLFKFNDLPEIRKRTSEDLSINSIIISIEETRRLVEMNDKNPSYEELKDLLNLRKQIILYGVPGTGKSRFITEIEGDFDDCTKIQFHPSTTYEDFIGGSTIEDGNIITEPGKFLEKCIEAENNISKRYLFVIDEINRGNISKIFGETILALDREYKVDLIKPINVGEESIASFKIPENIFIVATMNSSDRSIAVLDYAIRRRFAFVKLHPNYEIVRELSSIDHLGISIEKLYKCINKKIIEVLGEENLLLGQAYFLPSFLERQDEKIIWTPKDLRMVFNYSILPILEEYTYGNDNDFIAIIGDKIASRIYNDTEFIDELKRIFPEIII